MLKRLLEINFTIHFIGRDYIRFMFIDDALCLLFSSEYIILFNLRSIQVQVHSHMFNCQRECFAS